MNTLIVYSTKYGCTKKCAEMLAKKLNDKVELCNLKEGKTPNLSKYDKIIIGGSIYIGKIQKEVSAFCSSNLNILKERKIGLFICCMRDGNIAETELSENFPLELFTSSIICQNFGWELIFKNMGFIDRFIVKRVSKIDKDTSNILDFNIDKFAQAMNQA